MIAQLLPLPCGCVVDAEARLVYSDGAAECPWCMSAFDVREWVAWLASDAAPMWIRPSRPWPVRRVVEQLAAGGGA